jgi:CheY-like chemotaxis protein
MSKKILVVDDENSVRTILKISLTKAGFQLDFAENGEQAIEKVKSFDPDVLVLDTNMPEKSGIDVLKELKQINSSRPKVIIHTGSVDEYKSQAESAGADAVFGKTGMQGMDKLVELINSL